MMWPYLIQRLQMAGLLPDNGSRWTWVAARSVGTSHIKAGKGCDDFGACLEISGRTGPVLVAVASDGAGSAIHSSKGSWITSRVFVRSAFDYFATGHDLTELSYEVVRGWLDDIRDRIGVAASRVSATRRDFAATLVGCLISTDSSVFIHIGDGAAVYKARGETDWKVPTWPAQGEYAATTFFVTDDPEPYCQFAIVTEQIDQIAAFSDGLERLALQFSTKSAFAPFFETVFAPLNNSAPGNNRVLSRALKGFLDGPAVCEKTDDDKTLNFCPAHLGTALMPALHTQSGQQIVLGSELGKGGEGIVYRLQGNAKLAAKIYHANKAAERRDKIEAIVSAQWHKSTNCVAFPVDALYGAKGQFLGFTMPLVSGNKPIHDLYSPTSRKTEFPKANFRFLIQNRT